MKVFILLLMSFSLIAVEIPTFVPGTLIKAEEINQALVSLKTEVDRLGQTQLMRYSGVLSIDGGSLVKFRTKTYNYDRNREDNNIYIIDDNSGSYTKFQAAQNCYFNIVQSGTKSSSDVWKEIIHYNSSGQIVEREAAYTTIFTTMYQQLSANYQMMSGDYIVIYASALNDSDEYTSVTIKATPL